MKREAEELFTEAILQKGANAFGVEAASLQKLAGFENFVYGGVYQERDVILRFAHSSHRQVGEIEGELDWLLYLKKEGVTVCEPIHSLDNRHIVMIETKGSAFYVCMFEKAKGSPVNLEKERENGALFEQWGKTIGRLHRLSTNYSPQGLERSYLKWMTNKVWDALPKDDKVTKQKELLTKQVRGLKQTNENYMMIHTDLHHGNFFYDRKKLYLFDFDDCAIFYTYHDIAMPLYYACWRFAGSEEEKTRFAEFFFSYFLKGYRSERKIEEDELAVLPLFLKLRDLELLAVLRHEWDLDALNSAQQSLLNDIHKRVANDQCLVELDFDTY